MTGPGVAGGDQSDRTSYGIIDVGYGKELMVCTSAGAADSVNRITVGVTGRENVAFARVQGYAAHLGLDDSSTRTAEWPVDQIKGLRHVGQSEVPSAALQKRIAVEHGSKNRLKAFLDRLSGKVRHIDRRSDREPGVEITQRNLTDGTPVCKLRCPDGTSFFDSTAVPKRKPLVMLMSTGVTVFVT